MSDESGGKVSLTPVSGGWRLETDGVPFVENAPEGWILKNEPWPSCIAADERLEPWAIVRPDGRMGMGIPEIVAKRALEDAGVECKTVPG